MNTKYVTSLELSKKLKEAGLKQESEWYWVRVNVEKDQWELTDANRAKYFLKENRISAFHVGELGEMLPRSVNKFCWRSGPTLGQIGTFVCEYGIRTVDGKEYQHGNTEAEARGQMLLYLKQKGLI